MASQQNVTSRMVPGRPDYAILTTSLVLVVIGLVFVYSASFAIALDAFDNVYFFVIRQTGAALIGLVLMFGLMRLDYHILRPWSPILMLGAVGSLTLVLVIGNDAYGARRWIPMGPLPPFQPSEFAKLAAIIYISAWLASRGGTVKSFALGFVPFIFLVGLVSGLILIEPDTGTAMIVVLATASLFFIAGASITHLGAMAGIGAVMAVLLLIGGGHRSDRITSFISPHSDPDGLGFQTLQLLIALFAYLVYRGFRVAMNARDDFGCYLALGITCWVAFQTLINIGGITRSIPLTGIPLPFLSYGGSSIVMIMAAMGVLLSVSRYGKDRTYLERAEPRKKRFHIRSPIIPRTPQRGGVTRVTTTRA